MCALDFAKSSKKHNIRKCIKNDLIKYRKLCLQTPPITDLPHGAKIEWLASMLTDIDCLRFCTDTLRISPKDGNRMNVKEKKDMRKSILFAPTWGLRSGIPIMLIASPQTGI